MMLSSWFRVATLQALLVSALLMGRSYQDGIQPARADGPTPEQAAAIAAYKDAHDTDPHLPLPAAYRTLLAQKDRDARDHYSAMSRSAAIEAAGIGRFLPVAQQGQLNSYYCGPAAVSELLNYKNAPTDQNTAGDLLNTTTGGTAWSGVYADVPSPSGYPVPDVLNYRIGHSWYIPVALPGSPSSQDVSNYIFRMTYDIDYGYPVEGDTWEYPGSEYLHLWGHPVNLDIKHWFTIMGYYQYGNQTNYVDSATTVWSAVQPYNYYFDSARLVAILGGRGYVW